MSTKCEFADRCPIVQYFDEQDWQMMLDRYCYGGFQKCTRHQLRMSDREVPEYTMPWDGLTEIASEDYLVHADQSSAE